mmetsp:Transcript_41973/g.88140  ORF Transcript_41973/g.88140 Transcript_41973/m.88140 type:complete len:232 (-) Transcript_41973:902-1597(-)
MNINIFLRHLVKILGIFLLPSFVCFLHLPSFAHILLLFCHPSANFRVLLLLRGRVDFSSSSVSLFIGSSLLLLESFANFFTQFGCLCPLVDIPCRSMLIDNFTNFLPAHHTIVKPRRFFVTVAHSTITRTESKLRFKLPVDGVLNGVPLMRRQAHRRVSDFTRRLGLVPFLHGNVEFRHQTLNKQLRTAFEFFQSHEFDIARNRINDLFHYFQLVSTQRKYIWVCVICTDF